MKRINQKEHKSLYLSIHSWLRYHHGKASKCEMPTCKKISKTYDWALKTNEQHAKDISKYLQLCRACHIKYDETEEGRRNKSLSNINGNKKYCIRGHEFTKDNLYPVKDKISGKIYRSCKTCVKQVRSRPEYKEHQREYWKRYVRKNKPVSRSPRKTLSK